MEGCICGRPSRRDDGARPVRYVEPVAVTPTSRR